MVTSRYPMNELLMSARMRLAADWLASNLTDSITVSQAAAHVAMSERSLLRNFRAVFGTSPSEYLTSSRVARACELLTSTGLTADAVAKRCGLGDGSHLARLFRQGLAMSPTEYRKRHQPTQSSGDAV